MKTVEIIGYQRKNFSKAETRRLREEGNVICVLYGGDEHVDFYSPAILLKPLIYTPDVAFINLNVEGKEYRCILKEAQFHPVSEAILHADFMELDNNKPIKMNIPVRFHGNAPGMLQGGKLMVKLRYLIIKALPAHMPEFIDIDISGLDLGKSVKVGEIKTDNFELLNAPQVSIASVSIPRAARLEEEVAAAEVAVAEGEGEEGAEEGKTDKAEKGAEKGGEKGGEKGEEKGAEKGRKGKEKE